MDINTKPLPGAWSVVALLWFVGGLNYLDRMMITTMRGSLIEAIPMTDAQFGLLTSIFLWIYGLFSPIAGYLADRFSRSRIITSSALMWSAVTWLTGQAKTFDQLLCARALMGICEACYIPAALALIADYHRGSTRSLATGICMTGLSVGAGLAGVGGLLAERYAWNFAFDVFGLTGILYSISLALFLRDVSADQRGYSASESTSKPRILEAIQSLSSNGSFLLLVVFWGMLGVSGWAVSGWMPTYLNEQFRLTQGTAGLSAAGYVESSALVGVLIGGAWADHWSAGNPRARMYVSVIGLCAAALGIALAANSAVLIPAIGGLILFGLARSFTDANMMPILCLVCDFRYRATGFGLLNLCASIVGGLTILAGGALRDVQINLSCVFFFAAGSLLLCALLLSLVKNSTVTESH